MKISVMGIQISVSTIVTEIFIPVTWSKWSRKHDQKVGSRFCVLDDREREKEKNFRTRDMTNLKGEEIGVPVSYSRRSGF
jgi:hypothetical protein